MNGFLNIDKPAGVTSHDIVRQVRKLANERRVGHAGTLDPAATGVLVVAIGATTRLVEYIQDQTRKRYTAVVRLGGTTTTDDAEGELLETWPVPPLSADQIEAALAPLRGTIMQVPPIYSALHHAGKRLHELARAGVAVDLPPRPVEVYALDLLSWEPPLLTLDVLCGKGTYVRSLARDIGAALGCGGHLAGLRRTAVGTFLAADAVPLSQLAEAADGPAAVAAALLAPVMAVLDWPPVTLNTAQVYDVREGRQVWLAPMAGDRARGHAADGELITLLRRDGDLWQPEKVFREF